MQLLVRMTALFSLFFFFSLPAVAAAGKEQSMFHELIVNGDTRSYLLYKSVEKKGLPLMIVLHGGLGNAANIEEMTGMDEIADAGGFIVAYPEGTGGRLKAMKNRRTWNAGGCCGQAVKQGVNDVLFITKLIEDVDAKYSIDTRRVYVTGMSNGAMMAYRLASEIPSKIAAVIAVSGTPAVDNCDAAKYVPILHIHGDQDKNVPVEGGQGEKSVAGVDHRSLSDTMNLITKARQCSSPEQTTLHGNIQVTKYNCSSGAPVQLYVIKGGGHVWPGGLKDAGSVEHDFSASKLAWEFAKQFVK